MLFRAEKLSAKKELVYGFNSISHAIKSQWDNGNINLSDPATCLVTLVIAPFNFNYMAPKFQKITFEPFCLSSTFAHVFDVFALYCRTFFAVFQLLSDCCRRANWISFNKLFLIDQRQALYKLGISLRCRKKTDIRHFIRDSSTTVTVDNQLCQLSFMYRVFYATFHHHEMSLTSSERRISPFVRNHQQQVVWTSPLSELIKFTQIQ